MSFAGKEIFKFVTGASLDQNVFHQFEIQYGILNLAIQ